MDNQSLEERLQKNARDIEEFRIFDDIFMSAVFDCQIEETEYLLRVVLGKPDLKVITSKTQYTITNEYGHEVRLDVRAIDNVNRAYNVEVQRQKYGSGVRRARFNGAMLDRTLLGKGQNYDNLPDRYTVFITEKDFFEGGLPTYHAEYKIDELNNKSLGDGSYIVYVNGQYRNNESPIGRLMHDFFCSDPEEMLTPILKNRVKYLKQTERGQLEVCDVIERRVKEELEEATREAVEKNKIKTATKLLIVGNITPEQIASCVGLPLETVLKLKTKMA